ncbi:hypothetical protein CBOM_01591 [Ceraceosorus bombacis]|uniref:Zn(2)-C6 fungal-type domain-containing protein n=1 Tax=Ceraceosorus bombacis TaxID=401625 RepID=A0A0P1BE46_9BASI|nr:hypothetical protein CBOM_01591 [Ceraceosorus bombacis]
MSAPGERGNHQARHRLGSNPSTTDDSRRIHAALSTTLDVSHAPVNLDEASQASPANLNLYHDPSLQNHASGMLWAHQQHYPEHRVSQSYVESVTPTQPAGLPIIPEQFGGHSQLLQTRQTHPSPSTAYPSSRPEWPMSPTADPQRASTIASYTDAGQPVLHQDVSNLWRQFRVPELPGSRSADTSSGVLAAYPVLSSSHAYIDDDQRGTLNPFARNWRAQAPQAPAPVTGLGFYGMPESIWHSPSGGGASLDQAPPASPLTEQSASAYAAPSGSQRWSGSPAEQWSSEGVSPPTLDLSSAFYSQAERPQFQSGPAAPVRSKSGRKGVRRARAPTMSAVSSSTQIESGSASRSMRRFSTIGTSSSQPLRADSASSQSPEMARNSTGDLTFQGSPTASITTTANFFNESDKRASIACVLCRKRKLRCDQAEPCRQCERRGLRCEYALTQSQSQRVDEPSSSTGATATPGTSKSHGRRKSITGRPTLGDVVQRSAASILSPRLGAELSQGSIASAAQDAGVPLPVSNFARLEASQRQPSGPSLVGGAVTPAEEPSSASTSPSDRQVHYFGQGQGTAMNDNHIGCGPTRGTVRERNRPQEEDVSCSPRALGLTLQPSTSVASPPTALCVTPGTSNSLEQLHAAISRGLIALREAHMSEKSLCVRAAKDGTCDEKGAREGGTRSWTADAIRYAGSV